MTKGPYHPFGEHHEHGKVLRTLDGTLDFLENLETEVLSPEGWTDGPPDLSKALRPTPVIIPVRVEAADEWMGATFVLQPTSPQQIVRPRGDRMSVTLTNFGPGNAFLFRYTPDTAQNSTGSPIGSLRLPANTSRTFNHREQIWAESDTANTIVDVCDEYGAR